MSKINKKDIIVAIKGLEEIFGITINIDEIEGLTDSKSKKRKVAFKVTAKKVQKKISHSPSEDIFFEWMARRNGIHKDINSLYEHKKIKQCFNSLTSNQLMVSGLISLNDDYFKHLTDKEIRDYYLKKIEIFHKENYSFENRNFNTLTRSEKILIKIFYDNLH